MVYIQITLDEREDALYQQLTSFFSFDQKIKLASKVLPLGDISIDLFDGKTDQEESLAPAFTTALLIERKTINDLLSSIKDGRYKEQSYRLIHANPVHRHHILYLIEGIPSEHSTKTTALLYSSLISLNMYKGFSIFRTSHIQETAEFIYATAQKILKNATDRKEFPIYYSTGSGGESSENVEVSPTPATSSYAAVIKKEKKENITPDNIGEIMLCQIPGVSNVTAQQIMLKFHSIGRLIESIQTDPTCMNDICTNGGKRKISQSVITKIKEYLLYSLA